MTSPKRRKKSAASPSQVVELYGPDNEGWYDTRVMDWIALCEQLKDGEVRGYLVLRSLVIDKFHNHVRVLTLQLLCELIPSPSGGPSSLTRVRGILDGLTRVGLVTTPEGQPVKTSSRASAVDKPLRIRINDAAPKGYQGWRNTEDKLKALGTALADLVEESSEDTPATAAQGSSEAGRISDPEGGAGRISDPWGRKSDPWGRISDPHPGRDLGKRDLPLVSSSGSSLSPVPSVTAALPAPAEAETGQTRETASPKDTPAAAVVGAYRQDPPQSSAHTRATEEVRKIDGRISDHRSDQGRSDTPAGGGTARPAMTLAAAGVPAPRDGQADDEQRPELLEMLLGLPGRDRMNRDEVADMLLPLAVEALSAGWTVPQLRSHLARSCDPGRVFNPASIYRKHLQKLPPVPAGAGGHPAAAAPECSRCKGSGLAEDPVTFLPVGPCACRRRALAPVS